MSPHTKTNQVGFLALMVGAVLGMGCWSMMPGGKSTPLTSSAQAQTPARTPDPAAMALWRQMADAQRRVLLQGRMTITRWDSGGKQQAPETADVTEGSGGKYRIEYRAPETVQGRVLVCDGKTLYQYEPRRKVVLQRPIANAEPFLKTDLSLSTHYLTLGPSSTDSTVTTVGGRKVTLLELHDTRDSALQERRWVDTATGRSLRVETYGKSGQISRRVEVTQVSFPTQVADSTFRANFPKGVRLVTLKPSDASAETEARRLGLPVQSGGYKVRSAHASATKHASATPQRQLLYSDGIHSVSLFVHEVGKDQPAEKPSPEWQTVSLAPGLTGYAHEEENPHRAAVAWTTSGRRYIAVARLPLPHLLTLARAMGEESSR